MSKNTNEIAAGLTARAKDHAPFTVFGYRNSAGKVSDLTIRFCGREGHMLLLEESLKTLREGMDRDALETELGEVVPGVLAALEASLETRLAPSNNSGAGGRITIPGKMLCTCLHEIEDGFVITHLEVLEETIHEEGKKTVSRNPESVAKKAIEARLPSDRFLFRMDLKEGKFGHVEL